MKRKIGLIMIALVLVSLSLSSCRSRELCPAYTDHHPATEESTRDKV